MSSRLSPAALQDTNRFRGQSRFDKYWFIEHTAVTIDKGARSRFGRKYCGISGGADTCSTARGVSDVASGNAGDEQHILVIFAHSDIPLSRKAAFNYPIPDLPLPFATLQAIEIRLLESAAFRPPLRNLANRPVLCPPRYSFSRNRKSAENRNAQRRTIWNKPRS
jgi:hypothetical protein